MAIVGECVIVHPWGVDAVIVVVVRILFVENDAVFARVVVQEFLAEHDVTIVATIADALRALDEPFDAVLVDYDLDDGKGTTVVQVLRRRGGGGRIVGVSSHEAGNAALVAAGADGACSKMSFDQIGRHLGADEGEKKLKPRALWGRGRGAGCGMSFR